VSPRRLDAGSLELGGGLEVLLQATLETVAAGDELDVELASRHAAMELPGWVRTAGHETLEERAGGGGAARRFVVRIRKSDLRRVLADEPAQRGPAPAAPAGVLRLDELRGLHPVPDHAPADRGLAPIGASAEPSGNTPRWPLSERDRIWSAGVGALAERSAAAQWDATRDIPWEAAAGLPDVVERAVSQVMTYVAQNEYAAYYVPARHLHLVNPAYLELVMWLASHVHDEARHVEVFTKRALAGGHRAAALASTELSLQTLLDEHDFTAAALLLNVLGEGTFLDLLAFVSRHAPDQATATAARLAHRDERRHVRFGIAHIRQRLSGDPEQRTALVGAVERRAAKLVTLEGLSPLVLESLTIMSARSLVPSDLSVAATAVRGLMARMAENRIRRLRAAGFDEATARHLSELHTPNLM
jgi:TusA-related sulfurtransferase